MTINKTKKIQSIEQLKEVMNERDGLIAATAVRAALEKAAQLSEGFRPDLLTTTKQVPKRIAERIRAFAKEFPDVPESSPD